MKPRTVATYTGDVENHIKPALGAVKLSALRVHAIQAFYNDLTRITKQEIKPAKIHAKKPCNH